MKFSIYSFGCKVNQYESEYIRQLMCADGYEYTDSKDADIYIVNSCSVTAVSDSKCRKLLHKLRREHPDAIILLSGCMSQAFPDRIENFTDCSIVTGNTSRNEIPELIKEFRSNGERIIRICDHDRKNEEFEYCKVSSFSERTRAFVKIEDGCDRFCSYCVIPYARGRIRSKQLDDLSVEIEALADNGYTEIVLVGINLSKYGSDIGCSLPDAVECASADPRITRVRLGSLEPELLDDVTATRLAKCSKLCPQFHLSLQSGCDATLKRMNRRYTCVEYERIVNRLRDKFENASITTDIMVGFPGETDEEFSQSLEFAKKISFAKVHVFPYSRRSGTVADRMTDQLPKATKEIRAKLMSDVCNLKRDEFLDTQVGLVCDVLFERLDSSGMYEGYTRNYTPVCVENTGENLSGKLLRVQITEHIGDKCLGVLSDN